MLPLSPTRVPRMVMTLPLLFQMFNTRHGVFKARRLAAYQYAPSRAHLRNNKERANLSFLLVLMFFGVFGVIVLTEIFMVDERGRGQGVLVRHGAPTRQRAADAHPDYDEPFVPVSVTATAGCLVGYSGFQRLILWQDPPPQPPVIFHSQEKLKQGSPLRLPAARERGGRTGFATPFTQSSGEALPSPPPHGARGAVPAPHAK